jgi:hypothetical protein
MLGARIGHAETLDPGGARHGRVVDEEVLQPREQGSRLLARRPESVRDHVEGGSAEAGTHS